MFGSKIHPENLKNRAMARAIINEGCIDLSGCERTDRGEYILPDFIENRDYCNAETEEWIWSIGRDKETGEILAAHDTRFYGHPSYECLWLR